MNVMKSVLKLLKMREFKIFIGIAIIMAIMLLTSCKKQIEVTGITLSDKEISMELGAWYNLTATVLPAHATDKTVAWTSSNIGVAPVTDGVVVGNMIGKSTIIAKAGNYTATCEVNVVKTVPVSSITLNETSLTPLVG